MNIKSTRFNPKLWLSLAIVTFVFFVDLFLPLGVASAVPYLFAVLIAMSAPPSWVGWFVTTLCIILTFVKMGIHPDRGTTEMWKVLANRGLAVFAIGLIGVLGWLRQKSEAARQLAEEKLREKQAEFSRLNRMRTLGEMAAGLGHELNQPLATMTIQLEMAVQRAQNPSCSLAEVSTSLEQILKQVSRAAEIVRSLRRLVKRSNPAQDVLGSTQLVMGAIQLMDWQASKGNVTLQTDLCRPSVSFLGDRVQLEQVLVNLIQNGIDAIQEANPPSRIVRIVTRREGDQLVLTVSDTGAGFHFPERAFERLHTTKAEGLGLGLPICQEIVQAHGGEMEFQTGQGEFHSTLVVHLPIAHLPIDLGGEN